MTIQQKIRQRIRTWLGLEDYDCMRKIQQDCISEMQQDIEEDNRYYNELGDTIEKRFKLVERTIDENSNDITYIIRQLKMGDDVSVPRIFEYLLERINILEKGLVILEKEGTEMKGFSNP